MGLLRLLFLLAVLVAAAVILRDVLRRLGAWVDAQPGAGGLGGRTEGERPRLIAMQRSPWEVLGLPQGASRLEIERAWRRILAENDPERVSGLSPELQELASRLREEATEARAALVRAEAEAEDPEA